MRGYALAFGLLVGACSSADDPRHQEMMDRIEARIRLPDQARGLDDYARYYTRNDEGWVYGVYSALQVDQTDMNLAPGKRRWLEDRGRLPFANGGGCKVVHVAYHVASDRLEQPSCNSHKGPITR